MKETERVTIDAVKATAAQLERAGLIVIIRAPSSDHLVEAARALQGGGVRAMEITLNTPGALEAIAKIRAEIPGILCGAGTILEADNARAAVEAGAQFIVTPTLQMDSIAFCRAQGVPMVAGCASPTEALAAHRVGADFIKVFPAARFSLPHIAAMLEELPQLNVVPTGGVTPENLAGFFEAGCRAVAAGSNLVTKEILRTQDWKSLETAARRYVQAIELQRTRLPTINH
jgi:2-dehydro-3-deoxyphosphogluconate aldolase/(4S)-4-hydroxy-2-oxoglutarate aldolase